MASLFKGLKMVNFTYEFLPETFPRLALVALSKSFLDALKSFGALPIPNPDPSVSPINVPSSAIGKPAL